MIWVLNLSLSLKTSESRLGWRESYVVMAPAAALFPVLQKALEQHIPIYWLYRRPLDCVLLIWWQLYNSPLRVISVVKLSSSQPVPSGPFLNLSDLFLIDGLNLPCSISNLCTIQTWQHSFKCKLCRRLFIHRNGLYISRRWWSRSGTKSKHRSRFFFFFLNCTVVHF